MTRWDDETLVARSEDRGWLFYLQEGRLPTAEEYEVIRGISAKVFRELDGARVVGGEE